MTDAAENHPANTASPISTDRPVHRRTLAALVGLGAAAASQTFNTTTASASVAARSLNDLVRKTGDVMTGSLYLRSRPGDESKDTTSRITIESYQKSYRRSYGEGIRLMLKARDAKNMIAWYDAFSSKTARPIAWVGAHYGTYVPGLIHKHFAVETSNKAGALHSRFTITYGEDLVKTGFNATHVQHTASQGGRFWLTVSPNQQTSQERSLLFSTGVDASSRERRWGIIADTTRETGAASGSDLKIVRYSNKGAPLSTALRISRASGRITTPHDVEIENAGRGVVLRSPNGRRWRLCVDNSGRLYTRKV